MSDSTGSFNSFEDTEESSASFINSLFASDESTEAASNEGSSMGENSPVEIDLDDSSQDVGSDRDDSLEVMDDEEYNGSTDHNSPDFDEDFFEEDEEDVSPSLSDDEVLETASSSAIHPTTTQSIPDMPTSASASESVSHPSILGFAPSAGGASASDVFPSGAPTSSLDSVPTIRPSSPSPVAIVSKEEGGVAAAPSDAAVATLLPTSSAETPLPQSSVKAELSVGDTAVTTQPATETPQQQQQHAEEEEDDGTLPAAESPFSAEYLALQQRVVDLQTELESAKARASRDEERYRALEHEHLVLRAKHDKVAQKQALAQLGGEEVQALVTSLRADRDKLADALMQQERLVDAEVAKNQKLSSALSECRSVQRQLELDRQEVEARLLPLSFRTQQLEQELSLSRERCAGLEQDVASVRSRHAAFVKEYTEKVGLAHQQLQEAQQDVSELRQQLAAEKQRGNERAQALVDEVEVLRSEMVGKQVQLDRLATQLQTETALCHAVKRAKEDAEARVAAAARQLERLQRDLARERAEKHELEVAVDTATKARAAAEGELHNAQAQVQDLEQRLVEAVSKYERLQQEAEATVRAAESRVKAIEEERAREVSGEDLNSAVAMLARDAARKGGEAVTGCVQLPNGVVVSVVEIYNKYVALTQELRECEREKRNVDHYLRQMQHELAEKAPLLQEQKQQHQRLAQAHAALMVELGECRKQLQEAQQRAHAAAEAKAKTDKVLEATQQEASDLARQVRQLLKRQAAVGAANNSGSSADALIQEHLVVFSSIDELQARNQQLLVLTRQLAASNEELQRQKEQLSAQVEEARERESEVEQLADVVAVLKQQRSGLEARLQALMQAQALREKEREEAKEQETQPQQGDAASEAPVTTASLTTALMLEQTQAKLTRTLATLEHMQGEIADNDRARAAAEAELKVVEGELEQCRVQARVAKEESEKDMDVLRSQLDSERVTNGEVRMRLARVEAELRRATSAAQLIRARVEELEVENRELNAAHAQLHSRLAVHQEELSAATALRVEAEEEARARRSECEILKAQVTAVSASEQRMREDNARMSARQEKQEQLLLSLQTLQGEMREAEDERKKKAVLEREDLKSEISRARKEAEDARERQRHWEQQCDTVRKQLQEAEAKAAGTERDLRAEVSRLEAMLSSAQAERERLEKVVAELQQRVSTLVTSSIMSNSSGGALMAEVLTGGSGAGSAEREAELSTLRSKLAAAEEDNAALVKEVAECRAQLHTLGELTQGQEETLVAVRAQMVEYQESKEKEVRGLTQRQSELLQRIELLHSGSVEREAEIEKLQDSISAAERAKDAAEALAARVRESMEQEVTAVRNECERLAEEAQIHSRLAGEAQEKYQREMLLHSDDVRLLSKVQAELKEVKGECERLRKEVADAKAQDRGEKAALELLAKSRGAEVEEYRQRCEALERQVDALLAQVGEKRSDDDYDSASGAADLTEVVSYLRKEKDVLVLELHKCRQQCAELQHTVELHEGTVRMLQSQLAQESAEDAQAQEALARMSESIGSLDAEVLFTPRKTPAKKHAATPRGADLQQSFSAFQTQISLLRESNDMLRGETAKAKEKAVQAEKRVKELELEMLPLTMQVTTLTAEREGLVAAKKTLESECERWRARNKQLLSKYDQIDPELHRQVVAERDGLQQQVATLTQSLGTLTAAHSEQEAALASKAAELESVNKRLAAVNAELKSVAAARDSVSKALSAATAQCDTYESKAKEAEQEVAALQERYDAAVAEAHEAREKARVAEEQAARPRIPKKVMDEIKALRAHQAQGMTVRAEMEAALQRAQDTLAACDRALEEKERVLAEVQRDRAELTERLEIMQSEVSQGQAAASAQREMELKLQSVEKRMRAEIASLQRRGDAQSVDIERLTVEKAEAEATARELHNKLHKMNQDIENSSVIIEGLKSRLEQEEERTRDFQERMREEEEKAQLQLEALERAEAQVSELQRELAHLPMVTEAAAAEEAEEVVDAEAEAEEAAHKRAADMDDVDVEAETTAASEEPQVMEEEAVSSSTPADVEEVEEPLAEEGSVSLAASPAASPALTAASTLSSPATRALVLETPLHGGATDSAVEELTLPPVAAEPVASPVATVEDASPAPNSTETQGLKRKRVASEDEEVVKRVRDSEEEEEGMVDVSLTAAEPSSATVEAGDADAESMEAGEGVEVDAAFDQEQEQEQEPGMAEEEVATASTEDAETAAHADADARDARDTAGDVENDEDVGELPQGEVSYGDEDEDVEVFEDEDGYTWGEGDELAYEEDEDMEAPLSHEAEEAEDEVLGDDAEPGDDAGEDAVLE